MCSRTRYDAAAAKRMEQSTDNSCLSETKYEHWSPQWCGNRLSPIIRHQVALHTHTHAREHTYAYKLQPYGLIYYCQINQAFWALFRLVTSRAAGVFRRLRSFSSLVVPKIRTESICLGCTFGRKLISRCCSTYLYYRHRTWYVHSICIDESTEHLLSFDFVSHHLIFAPIFRRVVRSCSGKWEEIADSFSHLN